MNTTTLTTNSSTNNSISNTTSSDNPYRVEAFVERCVVCGNAALLGCPRCGRPHCEIHAVVTGCCPDCELELSARARKVITPSVLAYAALSTVPVVLVAAGSLYLAVLTGMLMVLGGLMLAGGLRHIIRRTAHNPWVPVANSVLHIAADGGERPRRRIVHHRERDMYKAAWNAGFNRVQGCG